METKSLQLAGRVVHEMVDQGSKSEREGVVLRTDQGESYRLRRREGPSFGDEVLDQLVGSTIVTEGLAVGPTFIMRSWEQL